MKTAISIPDPVFAIAEQAAKRMGISRSELYARAVKAYVDRQKDDLITEALDRIYADDSDEALDVNLAALQFSSIPEEEW